MADAADKLFGVDLAIVPGFAAHDSSSLDLIGARRVQRRGAAVEPFRGAPKLDAAELVDLDRISGRENVAQALILRLLTPRGSLAELGHAEYGSRLHELIGRRKTDSTRHLCRAFVLEAVAQEPRVEPRAVQFRFDVDSEEPSSLRFHLTVKPRGGEDDVALSLEVGL